MNKSVLAIVGFFVTLISTGTATALSCMRPAMAGSFHQYNDAPETYRVLVGEFRPLQSVPNTSGYQQKGGPLPDVRYEFIGREIGRNGPQGNFRRWNVTVQPQCAGPWCANYPTQGQDVIAFVHDVFSNQSSLRFEEGACGGASFQATNANMNDLVQCLNGRNCRRNDIDLVEPQPRPLPEPIPSCGANGPLAEYVGERVERVPYSLFPDSTRFIRPGDAVTMDHWPSRLNVSLSHQAIITGLSCG